MPGRAVGPGSSWPEYLGSSGDRGIRRPSTMAKSDSNRSVPDGAHYEYRVWGRHSKARKLLAELAESTSSETIEDCYFLGDDPDWNAKVRDSTLKVKHLVGEERGFELWASEKHRDVDAVPEPFDQLFDDLHLDRVSRGKSFSIEKAVDGLDDDQPARPVFVTKERRRFEFGGVKAEVTDITITETGEELQTLAIQGADLDELVKLRKRLGLKGEDNVAVHVAIDPEAGQGD